MNDEVRYLAQCLLHQGLGPFNDRDRRVIARVARRIQHTRSLNLEFEERLTLGQRLADKVAVIGGSWGFIVGSLAFLIGWAAINVVVLTDRGFDPYPFILLNLLLSVISALQAPIIMMSQNRQAAKDRLAATLDYEVNVRAENAIEQIRGRMDAALADLSEVKEMLQRLRGETQPISKTCPIWVGFTRRVVS